MAGQNKAALGVPALSLGIMNLPCKPDKGWPGGEQHAYKLGHRDARHAAADLALEYFDTHAAAPAVPAVDALTRYSDSGNFLDGMIAESRGEYVKFADVQALLATTPDPEQAKLDSLAQAATATDIQFMLADYHKEVWDAAQSDKPDYDYTGRETGKKIVAAIRALAALPVARQPQAAPVWTFKQRLDLGDVLDASGEVIATMYGKEGRAVVAAHNRCFAIQAAPEATSEQADSELRHAVKAMTSLLADREWAEHISRDKDAAALESEITTLVGAAGVQMGGAQVAKAVTVSAFLGHDTKAWHVVIKPPFGTSWVRMADVRDVKLAEYLAAPTTESAVEGEATERKPLTEAEIFELAQQRGIESNSHALFGNGDVLSFGRAIEQHHGITGGGK